MTKRRWDKPTVTHAIRDRQRRGLTLSYRAVSRECSSLAHAARAHFGTYAAAVRAAGIDYEATVRLHRHWTPDSVVKALRAIARRPGGGGDLSTGGVARTARPLYMATLTHFGSYRAALAAAGIDYALVRRPPGHRWPASRVLAEIRRLHRAGADLAHNALRRRKARPDGDALVAAAARRFGSYRAAVEAAGIAYASVKAVRRWDKARVAAALKKRSVAGHDLSATAVKRASASLYAGARTHFGTYARALATAGVRPTKVARQARWTPNRVKATLVRMHAAGRPITVSAVIARDPKLAAAAARWFGTYGAAVRAAGIDYARVSRRRDWDAGAITAAVLARRAAGRSLLAVVVKREDSGLLSAAHKRLGSWRAAVEAAGFDYDLIRDGHDTQPGSAAATGSPRAARVRDPDAAVGAAGHWTRATVLASLRSLRAAGSVDLRHRPMRSTHVPLFFAARELFGTYVAAVAAAGIDYDAVVRERVRPGHAEPDVGSSPKGKKRRDA